VIRESLLQFIWRYSLYNPTGLRTTCGQPVTVVHPGALNTDAGPDFSGARIRIGSALMAGHVELHVRSSDWVRHGHSIDPAYGSIVLHAVHTDDAPGAAGTVPVLELGPHIPPEVLDRYAHLLHTVRPIPCEDAHHRVSALTKESWLNRMLVERWESRLEAWRAELAAATGDWHALLHSKLAEGLGPKTNREAFAALARAAPWALVQKVRDDRHRLEALLYGQAGMLASKADDAYTVGLRTEYMHLQRKWNLEPVQLGLWKFLRMRPGAFPTLRISQWAAIIHREADLPARLLEENAETLLRDVLVAEACDYWRTRYRFSDDEGKATAKRLGTDAAHSILINVVAPFRFLWGLHHGNRALQESALALLEALPPEDNNILRQWERVEWEAKNAADSQALLQLFNHYCTPKRCLECAVGLGVLRARPAK